jgi:hypothetical protein
MATPGFQSQPCPHCGKPADGNFCMFCGTPLISLRYQPYPQSSQQPLPTGSAHPAARGFTQMFGLHPAMATLTVAVNAMIFGDALLSVPTGLFTLGLSLAQLIVVSTTAGGILGYITYIAQQKWYSDDKESAKIKALIVGFLTAIPVGLPGFLVIPSGIVGLFRRKN